MKITSVDVYKVPVKPGNHLRGFATIKLDDCFVVTSIRILYNEEKGKYHLAMPYKRRMVKGPDGDLIRRNDDVAFPCNQETRAMFEEAVMEEYDRTPDPEPAIEF